MSGPTAAPAVWPMPNHRTMAEVLRDEERLERARRNVGKLVGPRRRDAA